MRTHLLLTLLVVTSLSVAALAVPNAPQNLEVNISGTTVALEVEHGYTLKDAQNYSTVKDVFTRMVPLAPWPSDRFSRTTME